MSTNAQHTTNTDHMDTSDPNVFDMSFVSTTGLAGDESDASLGATASGDSWFSVATPASRRSTVPGTSSIPTTYDHVTFHDTIGRLLLTADKIYFQPQGTFDEAHTDADHADDLVATNQRHHSWRWKVIAKHQISPAHSQKSMLKLISASSHKNTNNKSHDKDTNNTNSKAVTFTLDNREQLEAIRKDVSRRLRRARRNNAAKGTPNHGISPSASVDSNATPTTANNYNTTNNHTETTALLPKTRNSVIPEEGEDEEVAKHNKTCAIVTALIITALLLAGAAYYVWNHPGLFDGVLNTGSTSSRTRGLLYLRHANGFRRR